MVVKRRFLILSLYVAALSLGFYFTEQSQIRSTYGEICNLIANHYYDNGDRFQEWLKRCQLFSVTIDPFAPRDKTLKDFQALMDGLGSSHFQIYDKDQDQRLWQGLNEDTGITVTNTLEGVLVTGVSAGSPAERAGLLVGDYILELGGRAEFFLAELAQASGVYLVRRGGKTLELDIQVDKYQVDGPPRLFRDEKSGFGVLEISSFRGEYFDKEQWIAKLGELNKFKRILIDVRQNAGGNFVSMLRALSPFFCTPTTIGSLKIPRVNVEQNFSLEDNLSDEVQASEISQTSAMELQTFPDYKPCYRGGIDILVSSNTSSVAEIFAHTLKTQRSAFVWGETTAGQVVLAVWYALPRLGPGYTISIPRAAFVDPEGQVLEGVGVQVDGEVQAEDLGKPSANWISRVRKGL